MWIGLYMIWRKIEEMTENADLFLAADSQDQI